MMQLLELTLPTPAENIALDEALLDEAEENEEVIGTLRLWESPQNIVVIGRSSKIAEEAQLSLCQAEKIEVLRRSSGGAAIVAGPGCLMYAAILSYAAHPQLQMIDQAHQFVLGQIRAGLQQVLPAVEIAGISDLALYGKKFSGNSLRCKRSHLLYHGTLLYNFPLEIIPRVLGTPPRQPEYRGGRTHDQFVTNLPLPRNVLLSALASGWKYDSQRTTWPQTRTATLVAEKYGEREWHERL